MNKQQDLLTIDTDIHPIFDSKRIAEFLPPLWRRRWESGNRGSGGIGFWNPGSVFRSDAQTEEGLRIERDPVLLASHYFDIEKIEYGIINDTGSLGFGLHPDLDYASAMISASNDVLVNDWLPVDKRFCGSIVINPNDPPAAIKEIKRLAGTPGIVQILMPSASLHPYGNRIFHPIYQVAEEVGLPISVHPGAEGTGYSSKPTAAGYPGNYLEWHTGLTGNAQAHAISLLTEGVFQKFPKLKFVLIECGVFWAVPLMWRLDKNWKGLRMLTPWVDRLPSEVFAEHVYLTTQPIEEPSERAHFHQLLSMLPFENFLMYSSDYPHWDGDTPSFVARNFPDGVRQKVMSENARKLYRLPKSTI